MSPSTSRYFIAFLVMGTTAHGMCQASSNAPAQSAPAGSPSGLTQVPGGTTTLHVTSRLVVLDVVVEDKQGHPVLDLGKDDFTIFDNGVPQRIREFEVPSSHVPVNADKSGSSYGNTALTILLYDELNTGFEDATQTRLALENYLRKQPAVMAQPTMLVALNDVGYQMLANYTQNPQELLVALKAHKVSLPSQLMRNDPEARLAETFSALRQLAVASRGLGQRKNVIWVGKGFPSINMEVIEPRAKDMLTSAIEDLTDLLLDSRISLSKIDPRANTSAVTDPSDDSQYTFVEEPDPYATSFSFNTFVKQTGGLYVYGRNDFESSIQEVTFKGSGYYTLSYSPTSLSDDDATYHQIGIRLGRPGLHATTREGYYPKSAQPELSDDQKALATLGSAANDTSTYPALGVKVAEFSYGANDATGASLANSTIALNGDLLRWQTGEAGKQTADVLVAIATFSSGGKMLTYNVRRLNLDVNKATQGDKAVSHPAFLVYSLVPAKATRMRVLVTQQDTGRIGSYDMPLPRR